MKKKLSQINRLLIKQFGIPARNSRVPSPLDTLIGAILSQNTNDNNSYKAYCNLKNNYKDWASVNELNETEIEREIRTAGLGKQKSKAIKKALMELQDKNPPYSLDYLAEASNEEIIAELTSFEGVGLKTASCVLLFSLERNVCPVDTHVNRTLNRIGVVKTSSPDKTSEIINKYLPEGSAHSFHTNLIKLGREICRPAKPACSVCPLIKICAFDEKNLSGKNEYNGTGFLLLDNL
jgi:endonuclease-3